MKYLSVCSGIEAATVAWHPLGWEPLAFSEIEPFPRQLLQHHYPDVPLHGDFTVLRDQPWIVDADVLVGGTPCQAFSVAGQRQSLADDRGNLTLEFVRLADAIDDLRRAGGREPAIIVWENVPGVLSVKDNAFGCFLGAIVGNDTALVPTGGRWTNAGMVIGPKRAAAWRILDAQYFGVAQRRRRVFVVASARDGCDPAEVLFEREGLRRDTAPRRGTGQEVTGTLEASIGTSRGAGTPTSILNAQTFNNTGMGHWTEDSVASALRVGNKTGGGESRNSTIAFHPTQTPVSSSDGTTHTLGCGSPKGQATVAVAFPLDLRNAQRDPNKHDEQNRQGVGVGNDGDPSATLSTAHVPGVATSMAVRRLTPVECERLQGFPDNYTLIPVKGREAADGPRYKALGNSMAVPVMAWIGKRIHTKMGL